MSEISPAAVVDKTAVLGRDIYIGPGCVIGPHVILGDGCRLTACVIISSGVRIGRNNRFFPCCVLGEEPQIMGQKDTPGQLLIGDNNVFREGVTINRGSPASTGKTVIGSNNYFMANSHLGHDCQVEDNVVITNNCMVSGHCKIECRAWLSGGCGLHQFVTIGTFAYVAGLTAVTHDVPPFVRVAGSYPCEVRGLNIIGLRRAAFSEENIKALNSAYRCLYRRPDGESLDSVLNQLSAQVDLDENVRYLLDFLRRSNQHPQRRFRELTRHPNFVHDD